MKILFVCTGNSCRSVMAKAYMEKRLKELGKAGIEASSAGILSLAGRQATDEAKQVVKEEGGDVSNHCARKITESDARESDLIFVMERGHRQYIVDIYPYARRKVYLLKDFNKLGDYKLSDTPDIPDPITRDVDFYRKIFSIIKDAIERILKEI